MYQALFSPPTHEPGNEANVAPVFKKGNRTDPNSYRPISVIPIVGKILERIVYQQTLHHLLKNNLFTSHQSGFRPGHSTEDVLLRTIDDWRLAIDSGKVVAAVFIDFTKAFDTISHTCLIRKLHSVGISDISLNWYKDFLSQRQQRVVINGVASDWLSVTRGVPQGSLLGPLLFSIYVNDMPSVVRLAVLNMYADDTTVYTTGKCPTQVAQCLTNELEHLSTWCQANHLQINPAKRTAMFLCMRGLQRCGSAKIYLEGHPLENKSVTDYLGVTIDSQLTFRQHVASVTSKAYVALKTLCHVKASLPTVTRILLYRTLVLPHLEYCSAIWNPHTAELTSKVERVHNRAMRYILDRPPRTPSDLLR